MTKTAKIKELKGLFNGVRNVNGVNIGYCAWKNEPWMIIENEDTWEDVRQDNFFPILSFKTREELLNKI